MPAESEFSGVELAILLISIGIFYIWYVRREGREYPGAFAYHRAPPPQAPIRNEYVQPNPHRAPTFTHRRNKVLFFPNSTQPSLNAANIKNAPQDLRMAREEAFCRTQKRMNHDKYQWINPKFDKKSNNKSPNIGHPAPPPLGPRNAQEEPQIFVNQQRAVSSSGHLLGAIPPPILSPPPLIGQRILSKKLIKLNPWEEKLFRTQARPILGLDCEMVGVGTEGKKHALARVSIVDMEGRVVYDSYVRPQAQVTDYRTFVSGIEEHHLRNAPTFSKVRMEVVRHVSKAILVGHGLENDFKILRLDHPPHYIRDTAYYEPIRKMVSMTRCPPLKLLVERLLDEPTFQKGAHDSREDAFAPVRIYLKYRDEWDREVCSISWENNNR